MFINIFLKNLRKLTLRFVTAVFVFLFFSLPLMAGELSDVKKMISEETKKIKVFEDQLAQGGETRFLADLLFSLSDSYQKKYTLMINKKMLENPNAPREELDFTIETRELEKAVDLLEQIVKVFSGKKGIADKALYLSALLKRSLGKHKEAVVSLKRIVNEFKGGEYSPKAYLELGDFYVGKNDYEFAIDFYKKGLNKKDVSSYYKLKYKIGKSYIPLEKEKLAFGIFYSTLKELQKEKNYEAYKQSEEELLKSLAYSYASLSEKERKEVLPKTLSIENLLRNLSHGERSYSKGLKIATQRLLIKKRYREAAVCGARWFNTELNMKDRIEAMYKTFEAWRKAGHSLYLDTFPQDIVSTYGFLGKSEFSSKKERRKTEKDMELILRTYLTKLDQLHRGKGGKKIIANLIEGYRFYKDHFKNSKKITEMNLNLAELLFSLNDYILAGRTYYEVARAKKHKKTRLEMFEAAVKSFITGIDEDKYETRLEKLEAQAGLRRVGLAYLKLSPKGRLAEKIAFNYAQSFYRERDFNRAVRVFWSFLKRYPRTSQNSQAVLLLLDSFDQMNKRKKLVAMGKRLIASNMIKSSETRSQVKQIVEETMISQSRSGSLGRNNSLLKLASKYKGTKLGDRALYEAFVDMKAKRNPKAYKIGEKLLTQYKDSKLAKGVVSDMAKMAIITADLRKAAGYFDLFAQNYPKDKDSKEFLNNSAKIYRDIHDFKSAKNAFVRLGNSEKAAEMDMLSGDWTSLKQSCLKLSGKSQGFYCGVAWYFTNDFKKARSFLSKSATSRDEEKSAGSLYFLSLIKLKTYEKLKVLPGRELEIIQKKQAHLMDLQKLTNQLMKTGHSQWGLAGQFLMGRTHADFNKFILSTPVPERLPASAKGQFKNQLSKQAQPYSSSSKEFFKKCQRNAEKMKVFNGVAMGCSDNKRQFLEQTLLTLNSGSDNSRESKKILKIRSKLYDKPRDINLYIALGSALLVEKSGGEAAGVLSRAMEIEPKNPKVLALLGVAQVLLGDEQSAFDSFSRSKKLNKEEPDAIVGQYYLFKKFKYKQSLKKMSSLYKTHQGKAKFKLAFYSRH